MRSSTDDDVTERLRSLKIDRTDGGTPQRRGWAPFTIVLLAIAACAASIYLVWPKDDAEQQQSEVAAAAAEVPEVAIRTPAARQARSDWVVAGYLVARRESLVSAEVTATVSDLLVDEGTFIEKGATLAILDGTLAAADLRIARSQTEAAARAIDSIQAERRESAKALERTRTLSSSNALSQASLDRAEAAYQSLTAQYHQAEAERQTELEEAERASAFLDKHTITAPFSGIVTSCDVAVGETVSPMSANGSSGVGICTIVDPSSIEIEIDVPEAMISRISLGTAAEAFLDAYQEDGLSVTVTAIAPQANRQKSTIGVRLSFKDSDARLRPNMAVKVHLQKSNRSDENG
ncbi:MAG: efflux RND transporter periplasmic adaptor subunit [Candidatus Phaeomarinobacter sp.]